MLVEFAVWGRTRTHPPPADVFYVEGRRVRPCGLALADGTVWGFSSNHPYRAPFGALLVVLGFLAKISS